MHKNGTAQVRDVSLAALAARVARVSSAGAARATATTSDQLTRVQVATVVTTATAAVRTLRRALATVVILLDQVVSGSERDQMSVVRRRGYAHRTSTSHVRVTQLIGQRLEFIGREVIIIPQDVVVRGTRGALNTGVTAQVKVELGRVSDARVDRGAWRDVAAATALLFTVRAEQTRVVTLLYGHECDAWLVAVL